MLTLRTAEVRAGLGLRSPAWVWGLVSTAIGLATLGRQAFSWDEAVTAGAAQRSLPRLTGMLGHTDVPLALYYLLMHGWLWIAHTARIPAYEAWLRLPSVAGAVLTVAGVCWLAEHWYGRPEAWAAGGLACVAPMMTFYAQDARPYALAVAAVVLSVVFLVHACEAPSGRRVLLYASCVVAAVALQMFAAFALLAHVLYVPRSQRRTFVPAWLMALTATASIGWLGHRQVSEIGWIPPLSLIGAGRVVLHLAGGIGVAVGLALVVVSTSRQGRWPSRTTVFLLAWATTPPVLLIVGAAVTPDLVARYAISTVPAVAILLGRAAVRGTHTVRLLVGATLVAAAITSTVQAVAPYKYEDYRAAADAIGDSGASNASLVFLPSSGRAGFAPYAALEPDLAPLADAALAPGGTPVLTTRIDGRDASPGVVAEQLAQYRTLYLIGDSLPTARRSLRGATDRAQEAALATLTPVAVRRFGQITVTEFRRRTG